MIIHTQDTPNPHALQFLFNEKIQLNQALYFASKSEALNISPLVYQLFEINGVKAVFLHKEFITITKNNEIEWQEIKTEIALHIAEYIESGLAILSPKNDVTETGNDHNKRSSYQEKDRLEIEKQIIEIIATKVQPAVAIDGGYISYHNFQDGVVFLKMEGACSGCPNAQITLKQGVESLLKHYVPEVESVEAV
ncbi:Fe/S biogenesis protein NfuA [Rickettsiales endosymbiont of Paramecium tredecaurelia]|uniref:NifU family protein n=1 Tax=Candidatus Sarmatiella mevalonica TaxID=2770581 RepID=UPI0019208424|nr:NifU family protein [Candidatus Sarmatiella mevalonica]MBL3284394.1 Fe/S biogenesis protein NfuA [Candidatus Sarmatiella mevalonica]